MVLSLTEKGKNCKEEVEACMSNLRHPSGDVEWAVGCSSLVFRGDLHRLEI